MTDLIRVYPWVRLGEGVQVEDFSIVGRPLGGGEPKPTEIGPGSVIRSHAVIYEGVIIGADFRCGHHVLVRENTVIGARVSIGSGSVIEHSVQIGDGVRIHSGCFVPEHTVLKAGCWIGPHAVLTNAKYPCSPGAKSGLAGPTVGEGAIVGANVTILPGVSIGRRALLGAGAVVNRDVEDGAVMAGNPARRIKTIAELPY
jgi:acetyltransferase-like isoleucine patch superfamily enzyme